MTWVLHATQEENDRSRYPLIIAICVVFTLLAIITVALRVHVLITTQGWRFSAIESFISVSLVCSVLFNIFTIVQTRYGLGLLPADRPIEDLAEFKIFNYVPRPFYLLGIGAFKIAICLVARKISSGATFKTFRSIMLITACFAGLSQFVFTTMNLFSCSPLKKIFTPTLPGKCLPYGPINWLIAGVSIATDCFVFFSPLYPICKTQLRARKKWQLGISFALGLVTTLFSALRMSEIPVVASGSGDSTMLVLWSCLEMNVGIITTSLPFLGKLVRRVLGLSSAADSSHPYTREYGTGDNDTSRDVRSQRQSRYRRKSVDNVSEEIILDHMKEDSEQDGIRKTTDVQVAINSDDTYARSRESW